MNRSARECLARGLAATRANGPLVLLQWLQQVAVTLLTVAGLLVPVVAVGTSRLREVLELGLQDPAVAGEPLLVLVSEIALPLAVALLATLIVWLLAFLVFCWFQGGLYGVLAAAERQAPAVAGAAREPAVFRTFSLAAYADCGARLLWRYFWFWNLYGAVLLGVALLGVLLLAATSLGLQAGSRQAALAVGCGGLLPLAVLFLVATLWGLLAAADLGREQATVAQASRRGLTVLARRPLAVLLLAAVGIAGGVALTAVFLPLSVLASSAGWAQGGAGTLAVHGALMLLQALPSAALTTFLAAAFVALMVSEPG